MTEHTLFSSPHRRRNALTGEWILVSPHRTQRPWQGAVEQAAVGARPRFDPTCYLCPGNQRAGNARNPDYTGTFVFTNDYSALLPDAPAAALDRNGLLQAHAERGICRVVCFSPRHDLTLAEMDTAAIRGVVDTWCMEYDRLRKLPGVGYIQIFENKGAMMGASNPHPHGQIWAEETVPVEPMKEWVQQQEHYAKTGRTLLGEYLELELDLGERIVTENDHFVALVPFWAVWPFETMIISRRPMQDILMLSPAERDAFAGIIRSIAAKYDNLFHVSFPYSSGIHPCPNDGRAHPEWHFHMHFYPPLLRSSTVRKFMVGYEMMANPQRDITAEQVAGRLRELPDVHYSRMTQE